MVRVVAVDGAGRPGDRLLGGVLLDLGGEQALAGVLVAAPAEQALLVAVVDDGLAAGEVHEVVGELAAVEQLVAGGEHVEEVPDPAHVVVAEERRQLVGVAVGVGVEVVGAPEAGEVLGRLALGELDRVGLEAEVERRRQRARGRVLAHRLGAGVIDLAEHEEVVVAGLAGGLRHRRPELLPEAQVHVLDGVDAEPVDAEAHPLGVDVDHAVDDLGALGEQVVQPGEVAVRVRLALERRVAAVVVHRRVVEPRGGLGGGVLGAGERGRDREGRGGVQLGEVVGAHEVAVVEGLPGRVEVGLGVLGHVGGRPRRLDHVGGVVGDDVEEHLHTAGVGGVDELAHLLVGAQVRVDAGEVGRPVAVVGRRLLPGRPLHRSVHEGRRQPQRGRAEALDVVEVLDQAAQVAAVVEALVGRVEAVGQPVAGDAAGVVGGVAVGEAVGHDEVEPLAGQGRAQGVRRVVGVDGGGRAGQLGRFGGGALGRRIEPEGDARGAGQREGDVVPTRRTVGAPVLVPRPAAGDLEGMLPGQEVEGDRVPVAVGEEPGAGAARVPVGRAAHLALEAADNRVLGRRTRCGAPQRAGGDCPGDPDCGPARPAHAMHPVMRPRHSPTRFLPVNAESSGVEWEEPRWTGVEVVQSVASADAAASTACAP